MRWNPFRRNPDDEAVDSVFESTVVEDLPHGLDLEGRQVPSPGEATSRAASNIGHVGRYALKSVLGEGGLGTVYAAWDPLLSRAVAVKTLHLHGATEQLGALDDLILNEARAAARLSHPHIVTIHDAGSSEQGIYIAMEPLRGRDLRHLLREGWRPSAIEVAHLARRVADALAYAHGKGVIHCDIKPANIFMVGRKQPKVLDFGIARVTHRDAPAVEGPIAGSPYYLAPEQLRGDAVDRRSDVYSLGVVMFELLTGQRPYTGRTMAEISKAVLEAPCPQAHQVNPRVPAGLSAIAAQAMARAPGDRHPSARNLSVDLRHWLESPEAHALGEPVPGLRRGALASVLVVAGLAAGLTAWWQSPSREAALPASPATSQALAVPATAPVAATAGASVPTAMLAQENPSPASTNLADAGQTASPVKPDGQAQATPTGATAPASRAAGPTEAASSALAAAARKPTIAAKERRTRPSPAPTTAAPVAAAGVLRLAISPWGQVSVDGQVMGTSPPLTQLNLSAGRHSITITNGDLPPWTRSVEISADAPVVLQHRFDP